MSRSLSRRRALENAAFVAALRRTGNAREAARTLGVHRGTYTKRRAKDPAFAALWDAALVEAHARLATAGAGEGTTPFATTAVRADAAAARIVRTAAGRLQLRRMPPGRLTHDAEQAFFAALSATANVRLSAAAAGFSHSAFYARARQSPAFAREMRLALEMGYERLELALVATMHPASHADDGWRHNDPPPIPAMTAAQALQLLHLHHRTTQLWAERPDRARRRGETSDLCAIRLAGKWHAERARDAEDRAIAAAATPERIPPHLEPPPPRLPALDQVTGWSKADPTRPPHRPDVALFGGWRLDDRKPR